jgi:putative two-component system response regulator
MEESKIYPDVVETYREEIGSPFLDSLTGLVNHGFFSVTVDREIKRCQRFDSIFTLGLIGIDAFKLFNKIHGKLEGDRLLKDMAGLIRKSIRQVDLAARYEGDLFSILFAESKPEEAFLAAERVRASVENLTGKVTVSIGLAGWGQDVISAESLFLSAQDALFKAKMGGRNRVSAYVKPAGTLQQQSGSILIVDDLPQNLKLMEAMLLPLKYNVLKAQDGKQALDALSKTDIDLILMDVMMPEMDGFEACRRIRSNPRTQMIPVILVTALDDMASKIKGLEAGANDFLTKPTNRPELVARTNSLIRMKKLNDSLASIESVLFSLAHAVEAKDIYTQGHTERVSNLSMVLGKRLGLSQSDMTALSYGGILHDIGKIGVPNEILNKPGPLSKDEWEIMQQHSVMGYKIGLPLEKNLGQALQVIRSHHEKMDGSGYPDGLKGDDIPLVARIVGVVDIFDALTTDRPYRKAMSLEKGFEILREEAGSGKLDKSIVGELLNYIGNETSC